MIDYIENKYMKKAAIYVRVSGEYQTVERQIKELTEYAEKNNYEIAKVFEEKISAYKELSEREKLLELFTYVENKECDVVLFSEFTRLARTVSELLLHIDRLRNCGVELYFQKQNLWVKDVSDYSTSILINVLGVISEYEVELFVSRSISGKINAFQNRNIAWGNSCPYGYTIAKGTKELVVDKDEASIVVDIFEMYLKGKSTMDIADYLNVNDIKPPFFRRYKQSSERRKLKGIDKKEYKKIDVEKMKWTNQTILYILKNRVYTGVREVTFHEADPKNKEPIRKRKNRKILGTFVNKDNKLKLVNEVDFDVVQQLINRNKRGRIGEVKRLNLLKNKLICGNCGSNFCVKGSNGKRIYKCYSREDRQYEKHNCTDGLDVRMDKLDGLVVQLVAQMLVEMNTKENVSQKINELESDVIEINELINRKEIEIERLNKEFKSKINNIILMDGKDDNGFINDEYLKQIYADLKADFEKRNADLYEEKNRFLKKNRMNKSKIKSLKQFENIDIKKGVEELKTDGVLLKELINSYVDSVTIYKVADYWSLVIVKFVFGGELWGTIKSRKYRLDEMFYDEFITPSVEYKSWFIDNRKLNFTYDKVKKEFYYDGKLGNLMVGLEEGDYTYEELNEYFIKEEWIGSFSLFDFEKSINGKNN